MLGFHLSRRVKSTLIHPQGTKTDANGLAMLDPFHIAAWGGIFQGGVIFGNLYGGL